MKRKINCILHFIEGKTKVAPIAVQFGHSRLMRDEETTITILKAKGHKIQKRRAAIIF